MMHGTTNIKKQLLDIFLDITPRIMSEIQILEKF